MIIISHNSVTDLAGVNLTTRCTGSSRYYHDGDALHVKHRRAIVHEIKGNVYNRYLTIIGWCNTLNIPISPDTIDRLSPRFRGFGRNINNYRMLRNGFDDAPVVKKRVYKVNAKMIKKRAVALSRLAESKAHLSFFSISFPQGAEDKVLYEIWNKWLTTCRRHHGLTTYLWVAERQSNGTLHYHMLTNNYLDIHKVNKAMAASINTSVNQGKLTWGQSSYRLYNGVDVDSIQKPKRRQNESRFDYRQRLRAAGRHTRADRVAFAIKYLTKYLTKQDEEFTHSPWHCSRDVSSLFTSEFISDNDITDISADIPDDDSLYEIYPSEWHTVYVFKNRPSQRLYARIDALNEIVYSMFHTRGDPSDNTQNYD